MSYINNFPVHWKYVSLFAKPEMDEGKSYEAIKNETMKKVLRLAEAKNKKREEEMM